MIPRSRKKERVKSITPKNKATLGKVSPPASLQSSTPKSKSKSSDSNHLTEEELNSIKKALGEGIPFYSDLAPSSADRRRRAPPAFYQAPLATAKKRKSLSTSSATSSSRTVSEPSTPCAAVNETDFTDSIKRSKPAELANVTKAILSTPERCDSLDQSSASITKVTFNYHLQ